MELKSKPQRPVQQLMVLHHSRISPVLTLAGSTQSKLWAQSCCGWHSPQLQWKKIRSHNPQKSNTENNEANTVTDLWITLILTKKPHSNTAVVTQSYHNTDNKKTTQIWNRKWSKRKPAFCSIHLQPSCRIHNGNSTKHLYDRNKRRLKCSFYLLNEPTLTQSSCNDISSFSTPKQCIWLVN